MGHLLAVLALALAPSQGGYTSEEFPEHGLSFPRPRDFVLAPMPIGEHWRVIYMVEKQSVSERQGHAKPPVCFVVRIDGDPQGAIPAEEGAAPITDFDGYLAAFYPKYERSAQRAERERDGYVGREHDLIPDGDSAGAAWCTVFERSQPTPRTFALVGYCARQDLDDVVPIWREMAGKMRFGEPVAFDQAALERSYERKPFPALSKRIELRRRLVRGWDAQDTEHYLVLVHQPRAPFQKRVLSDLEALHGAFETLLALPEPEDALCVVRLCETRDEYLIYGGDAGHAAVWNGYIGELVLFDPVQDGDREGEQVALSTLRGQAFAQYAHGHLDGLAHPWFTLGHVDYFSGAQVNGKSLKVSPSRGLAGVQSKIEKGKAPAWTELLRMDAKDFDEAEGFYPSGSLVHFLRESKEARVHERWSGLLERYRSTLLATHAARRAAGDGETQARAAARDAALAAALEGVDMAALDAAWAGATLRLKAD